MKIDVILNFENQSKGKWGKNYFFAGTLFLIVLTFFCYFVLNDTFAQAVANVPFLNILLKAFQHMSTLHCFGNMIGLLFLGIYFENKIGTLKFVGLYFLFIFISSGVCILYFGLTNGWNKYVFDGVGASSATFCLFAFFLVSVVFHFKKYFLSGKKSILNWICLVFALFLFLLISGTTSSVGSASISFGYQLTTNVGHLYPFYAGLAFGALFNIIELLVRKTKKG